MSQYIDTARALEERIKAGDLPSEDEIHALRALKSGPDVDADITELLRQRKAACATE